MAWDSETMIPYQPTRVCLVYCVIFTIIITRSGFFDPKIEREPMVQS